MTKNTIAEQMAKESAALDEEFDRLSGTTKAQRRQALDERLDELVRQHGIRNIAPRLPGTPAGRCGDERG